MVDPPGTSESMLIHLYRGELGRMTAYRLRLDTTTNWAIGMNVGVVSVALSVKDLPHTVFVLALLLDLVFLAVEARRYRVFAFLRDRVRLLETGFFAAALRGQEPSAGWRAQLGASLVEPEFDVSLVHALSVRLRRNYVWLVLFGFCGWLVKLNQLGPLPEAAGVGGVPGRVVIVLVGVTLLALVVLAFAHRAVEEG